MRRDFPHPFRDGEADTAALRVVGEKTDAALFCRRSTALYPDISLWAFEWTEEKRVRAVTVGLLTSQNQTDIGGYEWLSFVPHTAVEALYRSLEIGPYAYLKDTSLAGLYRRYSTYVWTAGLILKVV